MVHSSVKKNPKLNLTIILSFGVDVFHADIQTHMMKHIAAAYNFFSDVLKVGSISFTAFTFNILNRT